MFIGPDIVVAISESQVAEDYPQFDTNFQSNKPILTTSLETF